MRSNEFAIFHDPLVKAAADAHGLDVVAPPWEMNIETGDDEIARDAMPGAPVISITRDGAYLQWREQGITYSHNPAMSIVTLKGRSTPQMILAAMVERCLADIVDVPGAEEMVVVEAINSRALSSDPTDTRISVRRKT